MSKEQLQQRISEVVAEFNELQGRLKQIIETEKAEEATETPK